MKKIIFILAVVSYLYSCSNGGNVSSSNNNNSSNGNVDYYFKIKINGVEHKIQGNTSDLGGYNPNVCSANIGTTTVLTFIIADVTRPNYVSGQNLQVQVHIPNCHVGLNQATIYINNSPVLDSFHVNSGTTGFYAWVENSGLYCINTNNCPSYLSSYTNKITLNVTDMGTPAQGLLYGNTFKGSYNNTVYFTNGAVSVNTQNINFNIPMQFSIDFEAYRN